MTQTIKNFNQLNLPETLLNTLTKMNFITPTPIQSQTISVAVEGKDVIGTAQTGTGKTGAFAIPLAAKVLENISESVLVLAPTRELALQVVTVFNQLLSSNKSIKTALLIGGESIDKQFKQLRAKPRVIVGTPGRINDHLKRKTLKLHTTRSLVLDETDLMLDMGFDVQIETIIEKMPKERQTLMFSATLPKKIEGLAGKYLQCPVRVSVGQQSEPCKDIEQEVIMVADKDKYSQLLDQLNQRQGSVIIFVKTKRGADKLAKKLNEMNHKADAIHGDLRQSKRDRVLKAFRSERFRILVATDVAARGIDVPHIRHVVNYDLPQCPEDYIHRIGRTARAGEKGAALSFVTNQDRGKWRDIERLLDPNSKENNRQRPGTQRKDRRRSSSDFKRGSRPSEHSFKRNRKYNSSEGDLKVNSTPRSSEHTFRKNERSTASEDGFKRKDRLDPNKGGFKRSNNKPRRKSKVAA